MHQRVFPRKSVEFKDFDRFKLTSKNFERQYASIYLARLELLRDNLTERAKSKWEQYEVVKLSDIVEKPVNELYIVIGTIYKHQELKPSILRELSEELQLVPQPSRSHYASSKDTLFLEDETSRVKLNGNHMSTEKTVTGLVCALLGRELGNGTFWVEDWCFPGCCPKPDTLAPSKKEGKILLISGLDLVDNIHPLSLSLLSEWISGMVGSSVAQEDEATIVRIIIAGNSVRGSVKTYNHRSYLQNKIRDQAQITETVLSMHKLDDFLRSIVQNCCVTLMPGEFDPASFSLPQQPFHPCTLPQSSRYKSLHVATNPWIGSIGSRVIAGSSGQPVMDIMKVAGLADLSALTWLEQTLHWRHFAPTAPDTLLAYPYFQYDPFVMTQCPDIYFAGNMEAYDTKLVTADGGQTVRLICVPKFSETQTAVLVDLFDLKTWPISFGAG